MLIFILFLFDLFFIGIYFSFTFAFLWRFFLLYISRIFYYSFKWFLFLRFISWDWWNYCVYRCIIIDGRIKIDLIGIMARIWFFLDSLIFKKIRYRTYIIILLNKWEIRLMKSFKSLWTLFTFATEGPFFLSSLFLHIWFSFNLNVNLFF